MAAERIARPGCGRAYETRRYRAQEDALQNQQRLEAWNNHATIRPISQAARTSECRQGKSLIA